jgi:alkylation response protein AidB-like acyl-CoA dehydrogenase
VNVGDEVRAFVKEAWDPAISMEEWWSRLADSGWGAPTWPVNWYGRGLAGPDAAAARAALTEAGVPGPPSGLSVGLAGPTIIAHGTDDQKGRYLRPIISGEVAWCQLFSEPGAGSDLASLQCRAVRDGDEWVINGQKVWTSGGQIADLGMLLARTNVDAPKHRGITYFVIDMDQPGVEVRPLREMTGRALFNEVFFTDARVPADAVIGGVDEGWAVALTTLANERVGLGGGGGVTGGGVPGRKGAMLSRPAGEIAEAMKSGAGQGRAGVAVMGSRYEFLARFACEAGRSGDPVVRQGLARLFTLERINGYTQMRARSAAERGGRPGPEASTGKLMISRITRLSRDLGLAIAGAGGMLRGDDAPAKGVLTELAVFSPAVSIYGGSDEIQHNIIGERVLGLPKEPASDRETPFRELKVGTQRA